jgi:hypothetical protein
VLLLESYLEFRRESLAKVEDETDG